MKGERTMENQASTGKKFGYFVTMIVNAALIYVFNNLLKWNIPYLTSAFEGCLWAIQLSLGATIFVNFLYIFYDVGWFHNLMQAIENVFSWISIYIIYTIFPFDLPAPIWEQGLKIAFIVILVAIPIGILVETVQFFKKLNYSKI